jgi:hypothetical protein
MLVHLEFKQFIFFSNEKDSPACVWSNVLVGHTDAALISKKNISSFGIQTIYSFSKSLT